MIEESTSSGSPESTSIPPPPPMPGQPAQVIYQVTHPANGLAVAPLVVGIVGLVLFWTVWGGIILGILGLIFGAVGLSKANRGAPNKGMAVAGLALGGVALLGSILFAVALVTAVTSSEEKFDQVTECVVNNNC